MPLLPIRSDTMMAFRPGEQADSVAGVTSHYTHNSPLLPRTGWSADT